MRGPTRCGTCAALNKAAQPIHCACNQFIHPYRHTGKRDTQGGRWEGERATDVETEECISLSRFVFGGVGNQSLPSVLTAANWFATSSPAVWPVKSTHDVSLSQLWVEIHRINSFVRETHAWEFTVHCEACSRAGPAHPATGDGKTRQYP